MTRCPFAEWVPSPNYSAGFDLPIVGTMQHSTASSFSSALRTLTDGTTGDRRVSSHFLIRKRDGHIVQMVDTANRSWAQRACNEQFWSIEHDDDGDPYDPLRTPAEYASSARLNAWLATKGRYEPSAETLPGHRECVNTACPAGLDLDRIIIETLGGDMAEYIERAEYERDKADLLNTITAMKARLAIDAHHGHGEPTEVRTAKRAAARAALRELDRIDLRFLKPTRGRRAIAYRKPTKTVLARVRAGHGKV